MKRKLALLVPVLPLLALIIIARMAFAHAEYDRSEPAAAAVLERAPTQVRIWFTQDLFRRKGQNSITVYTSDSQQIAQDSVVIDDDNRRLMTVTLSPTQVSGIYTVHWRAVSAEDGHTGEGEFTFTVGAAATDQVGDSSSQVAVSPTAPPLATPAPPTPAQPATLPCLGSTAPLFLALGVWWVRHRSIVHDRKG